MITNLLVGISSQELADSVLLTQSAPVVEIIGIFNVFITKFTIKIERISV